MKYWTLKHEIMEILKHRLVDGGVEHFVCPKNKRKLEGPDTVVVHYTAGVSARSAAEFLAREEWDAERVRLYVFAVTKNGRMASDSVPLTVEA